MNVIELARFADVTPSAVRFYARAGVLPEPHAGRDGRRGYDETDAVLLRLAVGLHRLGGARLGAALAGKTSAERLAEMVRRARALVGERRVSIQRARADLDEADARLVALESVLRQGEALLHTATGSARVQMNRTPAADPSAAVLAGERC